MSRPGFLFFLCPDSALLHTALTGTVHTWFPEGDTPERLIFWGDEDLPPRFWEALTLQGFLQTTRLLVVRNAQVLSAEIWRQLSKALARPNPLVLPVFCLEGAWEKGRPKLPAHIEKQPCIAFARRQKWWMERPGLDERTLPAFIARTAKNFGLTITPEALSRLADMLPPHAAAVDSELLKLALFTGSRKTDSTRQTVDVADLSIINQSEQFNIFTLIRHIQQGRSLTVWEHAMREGGEELIFPLLALLQREARQLWQVLADPASAPARRDGEWQLSLARRIGATGLAALWDAMHLAELSIKSGKKTPDQALDSLLGTVTLLFTQH